MIFLFLDFKVLISLGFKSLLVFRFVKLFNNKIVCITNCCVVDLKIALSVCYLPDYQVLPPDLDDYIGHSRLLRKYSLELETDSPPLAQSENILNFFQRFLLALFLVFNFV